MPYAVDFTVKTNVKQMNLGRWHLHGIMGLLLHGIRRLAFVIGRVLVGFFDLLECVAVAIECLEGKIWSYFQKKGLVRSVGPSVTLFKFSSKSYLNRITAPAHA